MSGLIDPKNFADRLVAAVRAKGNPVLVGLDPRAENLPSGLIVGEGLEAKATGFASFCRGVIDVVLRHSYRPSSRKRLSLNNSVPQGWKHLSG